MTKKATWLKAADEKAFSALEGGVYVIDNGIVKHAVVYGNYQVKMDNGELRNHREFEYIAPESIIELPTDKADKKSKED